MRALTHRRQSRSAEGFTLVELLVVIGIIAVLLSILLPGLSKARDQASTVKCLNNQKQLMLATIQYANEWDGYLPFCNWESMQAGTNPQPGWLYDRGKLTWVEKNVETGVLYPYLLDHRMFRCPNDPGPWQANSIQMLTSYLMNGAQSSFGRSSVPGNKVTKYKPDCILYWEVAFYNAGAGNDGSSFPPEPISDRHKKGTTVGCMDGHAEILSQKEWTDALILGPGRLWCAPDTTDGH